MNNDNFLIEQKDLNTAQQKCAGIASRDIRNRAVANVLAANAAEKYFQDMEIDTVTGLHNIIQILEDIDISDIYINGNFIDVRFYFSENELFVPKSHFELNILPTAYMFVKLEPDTLNCYVAGFVLPEDIPADVCINGFYKLDESCLKSFYDVEAHFVEIEDEEPAITFEKEVYEFLRNKLENKEEFYKVLLSSSTARKYLMNAAKANDVFCTIDDGLLKSGNTSKNVVAETEDLLAGDEGTVELPEADNFEILESVEGEDLDALESSDTDLLEETEFNGDDLLTEAEPSDLEESIDNSDFEPIEEVEFNNEEEIVSEEGFLIDETSNEVDNLDEMISEPIEQISQEIETEAPIEESIAQEEEEDTFAEISQEMAAEDAAEEIPQETTAEEVPADDEISELSEFDYSTEIMPSMNSIEAYSETQETDDAGEIPETTVPNTEEEVGDYIEDIQEEEPAEQEQVREEELDNLFVNDANKKSNVQKKKKSALPLLGCVLLLGVLGYFGYNKFFATTHDVQDISGQNSGSEELIQNNISGKSEEVAMPVETVENAVPIKSDNQAVSTSIPAIEKNLNVSIEVSNLAISWEVPQNYTNNTTAKRYFVKIGKVLQLNLKTELLLLSCPPITNKISVELEFDSNNGRFGIKQIVDSSGVKNVDDIIRDTVNKVLNMNMNMNMSVFKNLQGNPILVIKL